MWPFDGVHGHTMVRDALMTFAIPLASIAPLERVGSRATHEYKFKSCYDSALGPREARTRNLPATTQRPTTVLRALVCDWGRCVWGLLRFGVDTFWGCCVLGSLCIEVVAFWGH